MRIALVTADLAGLHDHDADMGLIVSALARREVEAVPTSWDDSEVNWAAFDAIVMRSPWDYSQRFGEFNHWLADVAVNGNILNCPHVVGWNANKIYLDELQRAGVPVVPTAFAHDVAELVDALACVGSPRVVVKPTVSAGSKDTGLFEFGDRAADELGRRILAAGKSVMVQPGIDSVATRGERALLYFDGEYSHAASKGPILDLGGGLLGGQYTEAIRSVQPEPGELHVAAAAQDAIMGIVGQQCDCRSTGLLYARFDIIRDEDEYLLLEAELFEPAYFLWTDERAADRFATAVIGRLEALMDD